MVNVEHCALCALGKNRFAFVEKGVQLHFCVCEVELAHIFYSPHPLLLVFLYVIVVIEIAENILVIGLERIIFGIEIIKYVSHAQANA